MEEEREAVGGQRLVTVQQWSGACSASMNDRQVSAHEGGKYLLRVVKCKIMAGWLEISNNFREVSTKTAGLALVL